MTPLLLLKLVGGPGSISFLACASALGLALIHVWPRRRGLGRVWLAAVFVSYLVLSIPLVARSIAAPLSVPLAGASSAAGGIDTLVVLDGDNRWGRVGEAKRVWSLTHPALTLVSGDVWMQERVVESGIPRSGVQFEQSASNTREQIAYLEQYIHRSPRVRLAIVASRLQMPRVIALANRAGVPAAFFPAPVDTEPPTQGMGLFIPSYAALRVSRDALYERVATAYYQSQGWIASGRPSPSPRAE